MDRVPPLTAGSQRLVVLRLALYPKRSRLTAVTYSLSGRTAGSADALFSPRELEIAGEWWDICQGLSLGVDILTDKYITKPR